MKKKLLSLCILLILIVPTIEGQRRKPMNRPYADLNRYHLGFHIGLHTQDLILTNNGVASHNDETWYGEIPNYSPGFSVGVIGGAYINHYLSVRFTPTVHFGDKRIHFIEQNSRDTLITSARSNYLQFPLELKYSAIRLNNYRPYMIGGIYGALDLGRKKGNPILLRELDYGITFGFGCDIYLPYFKLCPELKFSFGLADILESDRTDITNRPDRRYSEALSKATSRMIIFTFNFE